MNEILKEFVDTLRDPHNPEKGRSYASHTGSLRHSWMDNCYCAGGILCDILVKRFTDKYYWVKDHSDKTKPVWMFTVKSPPELNELDMEDYATSANVPIIAFHDHDLDLNLMSFHVDEEIMELLKEHNQNKNNDCLELDSELDLYILNDSGVPWSTIADIVEVVAN